MLWSFFDKAIAFWTSQMCSQPCRNLWVERKRTDVVLENFRWMAVMKRLPKLSEQ